MNIILHPGSNYVWKDPDGNGHSVSVTSFLEHNHEKLPIYYLDFPLSPEDIEEEKDNLVISVHGFGFSEPYTGSLGPSQSWNFYNCPQGELFFERVDETQEIVMSFTPKI